MASYSVGNSEFGAYAKTLVASTVDTITFTQDTTSIEVVGDGSAAVYFTVDGTVPTVAGAATYELPSGVRAARKVQSTEPGATVVKVISAGTPVYSVLDADVTDLRPGGIGSGAVQSVDSTAADGFLAGTGSKNVTTAGTRVALAASTVCKWVVVTARPANTGKIAVGTSTVVAAAGSERGIVLAAGQAVSFAVADLASVNIDATVNGEGVAFAYGV